MTNKKMIVLAALVGSVTAASASPQITGVSCKLDAGNFAANVSFRASTTGATYYYTSRVDRASAGSIATTALRDAAGRTVAYARASSTSTERQVTFGAGWTRSLGNMLRDVMIDTRVQDELARCEPYFDNDPWSWYCPILLFIWDEELAGLLCGWMQPYPHP